MTKTNTLAITKSRLMTETADNARNAKSINDLMRYAEAAQNRVYTGDLSQDQADRFISRRAENELVDRFVRLSFTFRRWDSK